jgi:hypothetical protein
LAHMSISTYFRPNIHQNGPEILGVKYNILPSLYYSSHIESFPIDSIFVV